MQFSINFSICLTFTLSCCSWRPCWVCPSLRWALMTVPTQTAVSLEAAATRLRSARPRWFSAPVTPLWCHCQLHQWLDVAAGVERQSTWPAPLTPPTRALTGAPARTDHWDTGKCWTLLVSPLDPLIKFFFQFSFYQAIHFSLLSRINICMFLYSYHAVYCN